MRWFYLLFISVFIFPLSVSSAPITGPITPDVILHFHPELNALGTAYRVPVVVGGVTGIAEVAAKRTVGALLADALGGLLGPVGMTAIGAAQLCHDLTTWSICHSSIDPIVPISIDTSKITAATATTPTYFYNLTPGAPSSIIHGSDPSALCVQAGGTYTSSTITCKGSNWSAYVYPITCSSQSKTSSLYLSYCTSVYSCSSGTLTNATGAPMAVTGQYCTPDSAYSCPTNYSRSDSYGNLGSTSGYQYCSYQAPVLTDDQTTAQMKAVLLQYYADQLFKKADGTTDNTPFQQTDTTFDPAATPSSMPMTWDQLKQYVDWIRSGVAQTTDPLAPHYISPNNYDYTKNYITNNNNSVVNNTSSASSTITPQQAASSAAMTQSQYEQSNQKSDDAGKAAINAVDTSSMDNYRITSGFDGNQGNLDSKITDIGNMASPVVNPTLDLPQGGSCRQIPLNFSLFGHQYNTLLPTDEWCVQLQKLKQAMAYFMYILTAVGIVYELIRRPVEGN